MEEICISDEKKEVIRISVRGLVEFILRSGDLDSRRGMIADQEAMQMGSRIHRRIQGQMGANYRSEVPLKRLVDCGDFVLSIEGRADGILEEADGVTVDEIKGVYRELELMEEPVPVHLAQAKCYACIYAKEKSLQRIHVQMTYANLDTEKVRRFHREYTQEELETWFDALVGEYRKWAGFQKQWAGIRGSSIRECTFPYAYREGQKELAASVYQTIRREKKLFIQAPTGAGKTISTVFPAIRAVGQGYGEKIFYLTAKTITRTVAQEAFDLLKERGLRYKVVILTAKEKLCALTIEQPSKASRSPECDPEKCPYARGHFDRVNDAVYELLTGTISGKIPQEGLVSGGYPPRPEGAVWDTYTRERILQQAKRWQVCPFEMSLDLSLWVDAVICDYNYVFDPRAKLKRFFADGAKGEYIFLIDEAHNLVERGREMFSASLYKEDFLEIKRLLKGKDKKAERALEKANRCLLEWKRECESYLLLKDIGVFVIALMNVSAALERLLEEREIALPDGEDWEQLRDFYYQIRTFLNTYETLDECYEIYGEICESGSFRIRLFCIDTSHNIGSCLEKGRASVLFSATLLPVRYYMELLAGTGEDYAVYARSVFSPEQRRIFLGSDVSARYTRRTEEEFRRYASYIEKMVRAKRGNYLVFAPSYKMLDMIREAFEELESGVAVIAQESYMTETQREEFLAKFSKDHEEALVGFCVMGGIFGEGIDLKRERLIGALIVGTGLPQVCHEREILKNYYDKKEHNGFDYAYRFPGMNKVMQAAGRVIRTEEDQGVILLLDDRFTQSGYRSLFPREWSGNEICNLQNIEKKLEKFWMDIEKGV
ncbi:MAG: ATP-dependent DNA helicase [Eubacteriales bacterium]|nr:ATP-dependent DNA helicase [Eubacteriales bacterium]